MSHSRKSSALLWVVPSALAMALLGWALFSVAGGRTAQAAPADADSSADRASSDHDRDAARTSARLRLVQDEVARLNKQSHADVESFTKAGWKMVGDVPPPDHKLVAYDPSLLKQGREAELRAQLASTIPTSATAHNVGDIARDAVDPQTRYRAVEALGRSSAPSSLQELYDLMASHTLAVGDPARGDLASLLQPSSLSDPLAPQIAKLLDDPQVTAIEKQQIAFTFALIGGRDGTSLDAETLASLSPDARALLVQMKTQAEQGFLTASTRQGGRP